MENEPSSKPSFRWPFWLLVLAMLALAAVLIGLPKFVTPQRMRSPTSCLANLKQIDGAVQQWAFENKKTTNDAPLLMEVLKYLRDSELPVCPAGGTYKLGKTVANPPICSLSASQSHSL